MAVYTVGLWRVRLGEKAAWLRDREDTGLFGSIRPHLESFEPHTMDPVATIGR